MAYGLKACSCHPLIRVSYAAVASSAGSLKGVPPMWDSVLIAISVKAFVIRGLWTAMLGYMKVKI